MVYRSLFYLVRVSVPENQKLLLKHHMIAKSITNLQFILVSNSHRKPILLNINNQALVPKFWGRLLILNKLIRIQSVRPKDDHMALYTQEPKKSSQRRHLFLKDYTYYPIPIMLPTVTPLWFQSGSQINIDTTIQKSYKLQKHGVTGKA